MTSSILVVEDDAALRRLLSEILTEEGHACDAVATLEEALDLIRTRSFEVVLCDRQLGPGSGLDLLARIHDESPSTATVLMTGDLVDRASTVRTGLADAVLLKPFEMSGLRDVLEEAIAHNARPPRRPAFGPEPVSEGRA